MLDLGDVAPLSITIEVDGVATDPDTIELTVTLPDGTQESFTPPAVTNPSVGGYEYDYPTTQEGRHLVRWVTTGAGEGAYTDVFDVAPAAWPGIVSLAEAKEQLLIAADVTDYDEQIRRFIEAATSVVEHFCGAVVRKTVTDTFSGSGCAYVLRTYPAISITSVVESGATLDPSAYSLNVDTGILTRVSGTSAYPWKAGINNIVVTYVAGRPSLPANLVEAASIVIQYRWSTRRGAGGAGGPSFNEQAQETTYVAELGQYVPTAAIGAMQPHVQPGGVA